MGVYIKGMEMPQSCSGCRFWTITSCIASYQGEKSCPLIEVPEPHGRLGDLDVLEDMVIKEKHFCAKTAAKHEIIVELYKSFGLHDAELMIEAAPTVIPASEEGE